jgi:hypothetical protein
MLDVSHRLDRRRFLRFVLAGSIVVAGCSDEGSLKVPETVSKKNGARGRFELIKTQAQAGKAKKK